MSRTGRGSFSRHVCVRAGLVLLLIAVAGLSTLAKDAQYFPKTNPVWNVSISTKMNLKHAPVVANPERPQMVAKTAPPRPSVRDRRIEQLSIAPIMQIAVAVSMQHRSPRLPSLSTRVYFKTI